MVDPHKDLLGTCAKPGRYDLIVPVSQQCSCSHQDTGLAERHTLPLGVAHSQHTFHLPVSFASAYLTFLGAPFV